MRTKCVVFQSLILACVIGIWKYCICDECIDAVIEASIARKMTIEAVAVEILKIPKPELFRLGASTLFTLPKMIDLIRLGVKDTLQATDKYRFLAMSTDNDKIVDVEQLLYRHIPPNGQWYPIPSDISAKSIEHISGVSLAENPTRVCIKKQTRRVKNIKPGKYKFAYAYENMDQDSLLELFEKGKARVCYGDQTVIQIYP